MNNKTKLRDNSTYKELWEIAQHYADVLADESSNDSALMMLSIKRSSLLKIPINKIRRALATLILMEDNPDAINAIVSSYLFLDDYVSDELYDYFLPKVGTVKDAKDRVLSTEKNKPKEARTVKQYFVAVYTGNVS